MISSQPEAAMTTHINTLNLSDVALVEPQNLALAMQHMVDTGRGLAMLRGITKAELREVDPPYGTRWATTPLSGLRCWCASAVSSRCSAPGACAIC
jgi:hypothetical protein